MNPLCKQNSKIIDHSPKKGNEVNLLQHVNQKSEGFLASLTWQSQVSQIVPSLLDEYKLKIDEDLNPEFRDAFEKLISSLDKEVSSIISSKLSELETLLKNLKSSDHSSIDHLIQSSI
jgi:hypothetical protein